MNIDNKSDSEQKGNVRLPVRLVKEKMKYSTRKLGAFLYACCDDNGNVHTSLEPLSNVTGISIVTLRNARDELQQKGFLTYRFVHKSTTIYSMDLSGRTFFVPRDLLLTEISSLSHSAFSVQLYQHYFEQNSAGNIKPSIRQTERALKMSVSTVCRCRNQIRQS